jgi:hypothetical protein
MDLVIAPFRTIVAPIAYSVTATSIRFLPWVTTIVTL